MNKCVFCIGPESSGSILIAKICSHVLNIEPYGEWNGNHLSTNGTDKVYHRSLPYGVQPQFPNVFQWIQDNHDYKRYFILCTRDINISHISRLNRWEKPLTQSQYESSIAKKIMTNIIMSQENHFIWSYETFMYLQEVYLQSLYKWLDVKSTFVPKLIDGNRKYIK